MNRRDALILLGALPLLAACAPRPAPLHGRLVVLRHADRTFSQLNKKGEMRVQKLPAAVADLNITAVYSTPRDRNVATALPLAKSRGLKVHTLTALGAGTRMLTDHPGETIAWVGNQENLGFLYAELRIPARPPVQFGEIQVVTLPADGGPPSVQKRYYG